MAANDNREREDFVIHGHNDVNVIIPNIQRNGFGDNRIIAEFVLTDNVNGISIQGDLALEGKGGGGIGYLAVQHTIIFHQRCKIDLVGHDGDGTACGATACHRLSGNGDRAGFMGGHDTVFDGCDRRIGAMPHHGLICGVRRGEGNGQCI